MTTATLIRVVGACPRSTCLLRSQKDSCSIIYLIIELKSISESMTTRPPDHTKYKGFFWNAALTWEWWCVLCCHVKVEDYRRERVAVGSGLRGILWIMTNYQAEQTVFVFARLFCTHAVQFCIFFCRLQSGRWLPCHCHVCLPAVHIQVNQSHITPLLDAVSCPHAVFVPRGAWSLTR